MVSIRRIQRWPSPSDRELVQEDALELGPDIDVPVCEELDEQHRLQEAVQKTLTELC